MRVCAWGCFGHHQIKFSYSSLRNAFQKKHGSIDGFEEEIATRIRVLDAKLAQAAAKRKAKIKANCQDKSIDVAKAAEQKVVGMCGVCARACVCVRVCACVHVASTRSLLEILEPKPNQISKLSKHFQTWGLRRTLSLIPHRSGRAF